MFLGIHNTGSHFFVHLKRGYEARSNLKNFTEEDNRGLYCVKYEIIHMSKLCKNEPGLGLLRRCETVSRLFAVYGKWASDWLEDVLGAILLWDLENAPADGRM